MAARPATLPAALRHLAPLWLLSPVLLLLFLWTWTETAAVTLHVTDDRCTAVLYGRSSAIDCPGLPGGRLVTTLVAGGAEATGDPLARFMPPPLWAAVALTAGGQAIAADRLPAAFDAAATLRRPRQPAGLVLLRPDGRTGYAFILDAANRRGAWWLWDGAPTTPLRGIPLDRPLTEQAKPFLRQLLAGWPAAAALALLAALPRRLRDRRPPTTDHRAPTLATRHPSPWPILPLLLLAFAIPLHVAVDVLESIPHVQDSVTYLFQAQTLAGGALTAPAPPLAAAGATAHFEQEFLLVRDGRWFGKYPPGWPAVLALGVVPGAPWLVNPLLAVLTVALFYQLGRQFWPRGSRGAGEQGESAPATRHSPPATRPADKLNTDLLVTVLLTTSPFFLIMSGSLMAHTAELFWTVLFMLAWGWAVAGRRGGLPTRPTRRWAIVAGLALGALFLTRQFTALTIGLAFGASHFLKCVAPSGLAAERATHPRRCEARGGVVLLAALPLLLALPLYQLVVTGDARADPRLLYWPYDRVGFGPGVGEAQNAFIMTLPVGLIDAEPAVTWYTDPDQPPRGHSPARGLYNLGRNLDALQRDLFGWPPFFSLAFVWLAFLLRRPAAGDWLLLLVVLAVAGGYVAYWAAGIAYGPRYFYAALPALVILTGRGVAALGARSGWRVAGVIVLLLAGYNVVHLPGRLADYRGYNYVSGEGQRAVAAAVQTPALVFVAAGAADWWEYGAFFSVNTPWLDGPVVYGRDLGAAENDRLRAAFPDRHAYRWTGNELVREE